ncbi:hypothetical protein QTP88_022459 [Uroleucon formosanum]
MSIQRSGCEKRKRKACKEAELLKIKSKCSIKNYFTSSTSNFQSCKYLINFLIVINNRRNLGGGLSTASAENTTDSIFNSSKQSENKELYSDDVNMVNVYDPVNSFSKDRLEFQNRILKGRYKPILDLYPRSLQNSKKRSFQKNWYHIFDWLEYSDASDTAFCFPCRYFKGNEINSSYSESTFSSNGFKAWYRAIDAFKEHQSSKCHLNSAKALTGFINLKSIDCVLDKNRLEEISRKEKDRLRNREFMNRIIDIIICLGKSGRPFRGHDEKSDSCNQGLFKELVILLTKYDVVLQNHLQEAPKNALYTYVGHFEQLSIVFRYFDEKKNRPVETYITLKRMQSVTAQAIFDCLHDVLILMGKDWHSVLSVCFDSASTMAGKIGGVQTKCKEQNSNIKYIHCYAHCLNLALVDSVCDKSKNSKRNKLVFNFFGTIQFTYNFIESSAMRHAILEKISKDVGIKLLTLKSCSITRWACRAEAVKSVLNNYEVLLLAIEKICESSSVPEMCAKGMGLKYQLKSFDFIFGLYLLNPILNIILKTSYLLQSPNMDLVLAVNSVQSLVQNLMAMRNSDEEFRNIYQQSVELCHKNGVQVPEFITCPATTGGATKPNIKQFTVLDNKPEDPITVEEELNRSNPVKTSVPTKIRHVVTKSISLFFWPFRKSWRAVKDFTPSLKNIFAKQTNIRKKINIQGI